MLDYYIQREILPDGKVGEIATEMGYAVLQAARHDFERDKYNILRQWPNATVKNNIHFFTDIEQVPTGINVYGYPPLVVGYIDDTLRYMKRSGIEPPAPIHIPEELNYYELLRRDIKIMTYGEFKTTTEVPIFVKSYDILKAFDSGVIRRNSSKSDRILFQNAADDLRVLVSDYVDMSSEYRVFVKKGEIVGIRHYNVDCTFFPDIKVIKEAIKQYTTAPVSYAIDFAVSKLSYDNEYATILIEVQDMWAIGHYGLPSELYLSCLKTRWLEIFKPMMDTIKKQQAERREASYESKKHLIPFIEAAAKLNKPKE